MLTELLLGGALLSGTIFLPAPPAMALPDNENDGIEDWREQRAVCSDPRLYDTDHDNFPDRNEVARGANAFVADTDGDGVNDGDEVFRDLADPLVPNNAPPPPPPPPACPGGLPNDCDADGMLDDGEINGDYTHGRFVTDPKDPDSDNDGVIDGAEDDKDTDPLDPNDN